MKINKKAIEAQWIDFKDAEVKIRPIPTFMRTFDLNNPNSLGEYGWNAFSYAILDWKGFENEDGSDFLYNEENKRFLFDHSEEFLLFVLSESVSLSNKVIETTEEEVKN